MKAREVNSRIEKLGGHVLRQKGSHRFYEVETEKGAARTTVPQHGGDIPTGLLAKIQRDLEPALGKGWLR
jgi:predicted RNA binding protein YcfA (HicA-like mRNA interferase family)